MKCLCGEHNSQKSMQGRERGIRVGPPGGLRALDLLLKVTEPSQPAKLGAGGGKRLSTCQTCQDGCCWRLSSAEWVGRGHVSLASQCTQQARPCLPGHSLELSSSEPQRKNKVDEHVWGRCPYPNCYLFPLPSSFDWVWLGPDAGPIWAESHH